jgi:homoserine kinase
MSRTFRTIRVPASSANLGPGFDALGLALGVYLECRFRPAARLSIQASGRDADSIPTSPENMIWQTALEVAGAPLDPIELLIDNDIPIGKGLGSSAAAMVAGVVMANELASVGWDRARILNEAACWAESSPARSIPAMWSGWFAWICIHATASRWWCPTFRCQPRKRGAFCPPVIRAKTPFSTCNARLC